MLALLVSACVSPPGAPVEEECGADWRDVEALIESGADSFAQPVAIECMRAVDDRRVRVGFNMPPGSSCHRLTEVEVIEAADSVSITVSLAPTDDSRPGACPDETARMVTEVDLQAPVGERRLLDGSLPTPDGVRSEPPPDAPSLPASAPPSDAP